MFILVIVLYVMNDRKVIRMKNYDYTSVWYYFVTICTKNMEHCFWKVVGGEMNLNELWKITYDCRNAIPEHYDYVDVFDFICMPNHIHGILKINPHNVGMKYFSSLWMDMINVNRTDYHPSLQDVWCKWWSLWSIIRGFKIGVKKYANQNNIDFAWHSKFYDHIIRDEKAYNNIKYYIINNPENWESDKYKK